MRPESVVPDLFGQVRFGFARHDYFLLRLAFGNSTNHEKLPTSHGQRTRLAHYRQKGTTTVAA